MTEYHRNCFVDIRISRIFNTYGPFLNKNDGRVVSNFITQALRGEDITIYGKGEQTRSFCYITDMVEGLMKLMNSETNGNTIMPINLGNPKEISILNLAKNIIILTGSKSNIIYNELPQDDPLTRKPCIEKAKKVLGWEPKINLEEGLKKTIQYFSDII